MEKEGQDAISHKPPMLLAAGVAAAFAIGGGIGLLLPGSPLKARVAPPIAYVAPPPTQPAPADPPPQVIPPAPPMSYPQASAPEYEPPPSPAEATPPRVNVAAQVSALNGEMQAAFADCDRQSRAIGDLLMRVGKDAALMDEARSTARSAHGACIQSADQIRALSPPSGARGEARADFQQAFDLCADAMETRANGLAQLSSILEGEINQPTIDQLHESNRALKDQELRCGFQFFAAAREMQASAAR